MLTIRVTHPAVVLMSPAPTLALHIWTSATGPREPWGLGLSRGGGR